MKLKKYEDIDDDLKQYQAILLSGCACIGASHLGFLLVLQNARKLRFLKVFCGTSIGSIVGMLFLLEIRIQDIFECFAQQKMIDLLNLRSAELAKRDVGLATTDFVIAHIIDVILRFDKDPNITFEQLFALTGVTFIVTASKKSTYSYCAEYFSRDSHPHMKVLDAVNASICIPLLFAPIQYEDSEYIDGALVDNLPFNFVHSQYKIPFELMLAHSPMSIPKAKILDMRVTEDNQTQSGEKRKENWIETIFALLKYTRTELEKLKSIPERTIYTLIEGASLNMETDEALVTYYFHQGIHFTNRYLYQPSCRKSNIFDF